MKICTSCGDKIHPKRVEILPQVTQCIACSTTGKKAGVTVIVGEGDHTYNDVVIMDREDYKKYQELEHRLYGKRKDEIIPPDEEIDDLEEDEIEDELKGIEELKDIDPKDLED